MLAEFDVLKECGSSRKYTWYISCLSTLSRMILYELIYKKHANCKLLSWCLAIEFNICYVQLMVHYWWKQVKSTVHSSIAFFDFCIIRYLFWTIDFFFFFLVIMFWSYSAHDTIKIISLLIYVLKCLVCMFFFFFDLIKEYLIYSHISHSKLVN